MPLCVIGGGKVVALAVAGFTLAWTHTVEQIPWEEDWRVGADALHLVESRVKGSGAGMDPPPEARLVDGWYAWRPDETREEVVLRRSPAAGVGDWRFCPHRPDGTREPCRALGTILDADPVTLKACEGAGGPR